MLFLICVIVLYGNREPTNGLWEQAEKVQAWREAHSETSAYAAGYEVPEYNPYVPTYDSPHVRIPGPNSIFEQIKVQMQARGDIPIQDPIAVIQEAIVQLDVQARNVEQERQQIIDLSFKEEKEVSEPRHKSDYHDPNEPIWLDLRKD